MTAVLAMLILSRKVGEALKIGEEATITIVGLKGNQVRLIRRARDCACPGRPTRGPLAEPLLQARMMRSI